jgi:hypothetical protein
LKVQEVHYLSEDDSMTDDIRSIDKSELVLGDVTSDLKLFDEHDKSDNESDNKSGKKSNDTDSKSDGKIENNSDTVEVANEAIVAILFDKVIFNDCVFQELQEYLGDRNTNTLLDLSKKCQVVKKSKYYFRLTRECSLKYHKDIEYRTRLDSLMTRPEKQLSLLFQNCDGISDISALGNVHTLYLYNCKNISDVSALGNVHTLYLYDCKNISECHRVSYPNNGCQSTRQCTEIDNN